MLVIFLMTTLCIIEFYCKVDQYQSSQMSKLLFWQTKCSNETSEIYPSLSFTFSLIKIDSDSMILIEEDRSCVWVFGYMCRQVIFKYKLWEL